MNRIVIAGILTALCLGGSSCGINPSTKDDILKLGGISSTGNKDDEPTTEEERPKGNEGNPPPNGLICESPVDLSGMTYLLSPKSVKNTVCSESGRHTSCISMMTFVDKKEVSLSYMTDTEGGQTIETTAYELCGSSLSLRVGVDAKGDVLTEQLRASSDLTSIFDEVSGVSFNRK